MSPAPGRPWQRPRAILSLLPPSALGKQVVANSFPKPTSRARILHRTTAIGEYPFPWVAGRQRHVVRDLYKSRVSFYIDASMPTTMSFPNYVGENKTLSESRQTGMSIIHKPLEAWDLVIYLNKLHHCYRDRSVCYLSNPLTCLPHKRPAFEALRSGLGRMLHLGP